MAGRRSSMSLVRLTGMAFVPPARHLVRAKDLADARFAESLDVIDRSGPSRGAISRSFQSGVPRLGPSRFPSCVSVECWLERAAALLRSTDRGRHISRSRWDCRAWVRSRPASRARSAFPTAYRPGSRLPASSRGSNVCDPLLRATSTQHVWRRQTAGAGLVWPSSTQRPQEDTMFKLATAQLWVHDQDEALDFYTKKLGMEVRMDVTLPEMGSFRWLTVGPVGQPDISITLMAIPWSADNGCGDRGAGQEPDGERVRRHALPHDR